MKQLKTFGAFWYDFIIGDDWRVALGVTIALALTVLLTRATHPPMWWLVPAAVAILLPLSIYRSVRRSP